MSELYLYMKMTELFDKKLDSLISANEKLISLCEKNAEEINYLHKKIDELSENKSVKESKLTCINSITEEELIFNINNGIFDHDLEGMVVILKEGEDDVHSWRIIRVNSDSYDLWYNGSIGEAKWKGIYTERYWLSNNPIDTFYVRALCNSYKSKLSSSIRDKLKTGLNRNCGSDPIVILSAIQLGYTGIKTLNDDNSAIPYFNSNDRRTIGSMYWTSSANSFHSDFLWCVSGGGSFGNNFYNGNSAVVPAIRVGI